MLVSTDPTMTSERPKTVSGAFEEGGSVTYDIVYHNTGTGPRTDNPGDELTDVLPAELTLVSATVTAGTAVPPWATTR